VAPDLVGIAVLGRGQADFETRLAAFPQVRERLAGVPAASPVRGAGPLRQRVSARRAGRVLLVGDAAGYVDALTGEGLAVAVSSARSLVDCLAEDRPEAYERRWRAASRRSRILTESLLVATARPALRRALVPAAGRLPFLFAAAVDQLAR
jgi:flavin-dependent dehydrogenase